MASRAVFLLYILPEIVSDFVPVPVGRFFVEMLIIVSDEISENNSHWVNRRLSG